MPTSVGCLVYLNTNLDPTEGIEIVSWRITIKPRLIFNTEALECCDLYMRNKRCFVNNRITWQNTIFTVCVIPGAHHRSEGSGGKREAV